ncbi:hypothetical protein, partial [Staphylococcus aureus]|uniref:hypothetical protein n=1 Tax=Staphylococcus aureus TaxID=1280 RepID=UPI0039BE5087
SIDSKAPLAGACTRATAHFHLGESMNGLMTLIIMGVNFGISWWNAAQAGGSWLEAKALGGLVWVVTLCAAIQSALGFTTDISSYWHPSPKALACFRIAPIKPLRLWTI